MDSHSIEFKFINEQMFDLQFIKKIGHCSANIIVKPFYNDHQDVIHI